MNFLDFAVLRQKKNYCMLDSVSSKQIEDNKNG
jgi:hypothetical protein